jgi:FkbM family methyltransferase
MSNIVSEERKVNKADASWMQRKIASILLGVRPAFVGSLLKRMLSLKRREIQTREGRFFVDIASNLGFPLLAEGTYEPEMVNVIKGCLSPGGVFVDLGANEGFFSVIGSKLVGHDGVVLAIEPQSRLQPIIKKNLSLNGCKNVEVLPLAINFESKPLTLNLSSDMNTGSTSVTRTTRYPLLKEDVSGITLVEVFRRYSIDSCDLLKVDIEGYEYEAILGSPELFKEKRIKALALELHPQILSRRQLSPNVITSFLEECGYRIEPSLGPSVFVC